MALKDILVHIDLAPACELRLEVAVALARRFEAHLIGAFVRPTPVPGVYLEELEAGAAVAEERFFEFLRRHNILGDWEAPEGAVAACVTRAAHAADLVILGQFDAGHLPGVEELQAPEKVILACGRPVLMVPYMGHREHIGENVLVAWNGSREAVRAMHDALPLMAASKSVTLVTVNPEDAEERAEHVVRHLVRRGLNATAEVLETEEVAPVDAVLSRAANLGADLIAMGAYGHSRWREMILGGMTHDMLSDMTVPVLMAH
jgi:nucleotide-binding universal stress UspA family protein